MLNEYKMIFSNYFEPRNRFPTLSKSLETKKKNCQKFFKPRVAIYLICLFARTQFFILVENVFLEKNIRSSLRIFFSFKFNFEKNVTSLSFSPNTR